jgi:hypothetical protein
MKYLVLLLILIGFTGTAFAQYMENISDPNLEYTSPIIRLTDENIIPPPLKQFNSGIPIDKIQCKEGLELVIKSSDNTPACVKSTSVLKLIERGWTDSITHITNPDPDESSIRTISLVDNDKVISLKKDERFLLKLGEDYNWDVEINNQTIVSKVINIMVVKGAQGVYESHNLGNAVMTTTGNPICLATSTPCLQPSILLTWNIQVIE